MRPFAATKKGLDIDTYMIFNYDNFFCYFANKNLPARPQHQPQPYQEHQQEHLAPGFPPYPPLPPINDYQRPEGYQHQQELQPQGFQQDQHGYDYQGQDNQQHRQDFHHQQQGYQEEQEQGYDYQQQDDHQHRQVLQHQEEHHHGYDYHAEEQDQESKFGFPPYPSLTQERNQRNPFQPEHSSAGARPADDYNYPTAGAGARSEPGFPPFTQPQARRSKHPAPPVPVYGEA